MSDHDQDTSTVAEFSSSSIAEICERHGVSRNLVYRELKAGRLRSFTIGATRRISRQAECEWIALLEGKGAQEFRPIRKTPYANA